MKKKFFVILAISIAIPAMIYLSSRNNEPLNDHCYDLSHIEDSVLIPEPRFEYGIAADSFTMVEGKVQRNQNLSHILSAFNISNQVIHQIASAPRDLFDARRIRAGNTYKLYSSNDTSNIPHYFVYKPDPVRYVKISLIDSVVIERGAKEVTRILKSTSGEINSSLWNAIAGNNGPPVLAIGLSEIYAWSVDFFGLQQGDRFKVFYYENYIDSIPVGVNNITAAYFHHRGRDFYAIPFEQDSVLSFFDQDGNSLRRAFLKAPLSYSRISSGFSHSRMHPIHRVRRPHHGVDYAAPSGTPVYAIGDGRVIQANFSGGAGNIVRIRHNSVYTTGYMHLRNFAAGIRPDKWVKQGDVIGYVGSTGTSTGPHLDFRVWQNGQPIDPLRMESPPVEPVNKENLESFELVKALWTERLNRLNAGQEPPYYSSE
jgi:murein DD-endopeptidase MepM/ murein hydrolase activator NlpD